MIDIHPRTRRAVTTAVAVRWYGDFDAPTWADRGAATPLSHVGKRGDRQRLLGGLGLALTRPSVFPC